MVSATSLLVFLFGLIIGSFLNVAVYRYRTGYTLGGRSICLACGRPLHWYELIPLASFIAFMIECHGQRQTESVPMDVWNKIKDARDELIFAEAFHPGGEPLLTTRRGFGIMSDGAPIISSN